MGETMNRYETDRAALVEAFQAIVKREPTAPEAQIIQAIGEHETNWGRGWKGAGVGSNNVGAIQTTDASQGFPHGDSHEDGTPYQTYFRRYPSLVKGAEDLVRQVTVRRPTVWKAIQRGDYASTALAMHERDPVSGVGVYHESDPTGYYRRIFAAGQVIAKNLSESVVEPPMPASYILPGLVGLATVIGGWFFIRPSIL